MLEDYNYLILNTGRPTYHKFTGDMSHIDLALVNSNIAVKCNWNVLNNTMGSYHCPTVVAYNEPVYSEAAGIPRWKVEHVDWQRYKGSSRTYITADLITADSDTFNNRIIEAINQSASLASHIRSLARKLSIDIYRIGIGNVRRLFQIEIELKIR